jgi:HEAT repeat protein
MKEELVQILVDNGDIAGLLSLLRDPRYPYRLEIVRALSKMKDREVFQALIDVLRVDPSEEVRSTAAETLGFTKNISALTPLITALKDPSGMVRAKAAQGLGRLGDKRAGTQLVKILEDPHPAVTKAFTSICNRLDDEDLYVKSNAAGALGRLGCQNGIQVLKKILRDPSDKIVRSAIEGLGRLLYQDSLDVLEEFEASKQCPPRIENVLRQTIQRLATKLGQKEMQDMVDDIKQNDANVTYKNFKEIIDKIKNEDL